jgi:hypothetical protein
MASEGTAETFFEFGKAVQMDERWEYQLITLANDRDLLQVEEALNVVGNDG